MGCVVVAWILRKNRGRTSHSLPNSTYPTTLRRIILTLRLDSSSSFPSPCTLFNAPSAYLCAITTKFASISCISQQRESGQPGGFEENCANCEECAQQALIYGRKWYHWRCIGGRYQARGQFLPTLVIISIRGALLLIPLLENQP